MSTGTAARGYDHAAVQYASDAELLAVGVPFLLAGIAAGETTAVSLEPARAELMREALPPDSGTHFLTTNDLYVRPAAAIRSYRELMAGFVDGGATGIRIFGEIPRAAIDTSWDWWARYEAAVNHAYDQFPLRSVCAYDVRTTPRHVLDDVARTHPFVATTGGAYRANEGYVDPLAFLAVPRPMTPHPIQRAEPLITLTDPQPREARQAVLAANRTGLPADEVDDLVLAVSEIADNALRHGRPPVTLRVWSGPGCLVVTVHDAGEGPADPFAGLLPADREVGGRGLWITHQICNQVTLHRDDTGFTVRLTAGNPWR
ncbi:anti-sigma regulatory factor (Ser/Thr protein kinase) [Amycolatopsis lexingtonensis]|uniref:Anti-sigma regulatory factor (Ser/Thr protein kinase) n=1 Tax=Amycolatopsis lexingtonensis TaxID=218822 RepID=A0ABR9HZN4_9PSEU|nr:sensor histidine kinase [Amycolatopsis lexingtonensis]MBE1496399.1 anti-sigma regulatory factor (Ser/Thr protein kinase) [Amycolatopsis lexingtonensis]